MRVLFHRNFEKKFGKLPAEIRGKFLERLTRFLKDKHDTVLNNHPVEKSFPGCRSINVTGDYRAVFKEEGDTVIFIAVGSHSDLYK